MRILLAIDGSASSDRALDLVAALPWHDGGRVRIVTVAPCRTDILGVPWSLDATTQAIESEEATLRVHRSALEAAERELRSVRSDLVIESVLLRGRPASVIVDEGRHMAADLIVVGHRGRGGWESALLGSVAAEVVDHATCPVLVARDDRIGPVVLADDGSIHGRAPQAVVRGCPLAAGGTLRARAAGAMVAGCPLFAGLPITVVSVVDERFPTEVAVAPLLYSD